MRLHLPLAFSLVSGVWAESLSQQLLSSSSGTGLQNPIRRVVTLLEDMHKEISAALEKETANNKKFQCYCDKNNEGLSAQVQEDVAAIKQNKALVESLDATVKELSSQIEQHKKNIERLERELAALKAERMKSKAAYDKDIGERAGDVKALQSAIAVLSKALGTPEKGTPLDPSKAMLDPTATKSFLQSSTRDMLVSRLSSMNSDSLGAHLDVDSQQLLLSFLSSQSGESAASNSSEIIGILKQILEGINSELGGIVEEEEQSVKQYNLEYNQLNSELKTNNKQLAAKMDLRGTKMLKSSQTTTLVNDLEKRVGGDNLFLAQLKESCGKKKDEFAKRVNDAQAELAAINQAIEVLDNENAMNLFRDVSEKKALLQTGSSSSAATSFLQSRTTSTVSLREKIADALSKVPAQMKSPVLALMSNTLKSSLSFALKTGKVDFAPVIKMIDDMVVLLKQEQVDDEKQRDMCNVRLMDLYSDIKDTEANILTFENAIEDYQQTIEKTNGSNKQIHGRNKGRGRCINAIKRTKNNRSK